MANRIFEDIQGINEEFATVTESKNTLGGAKRVEIAYGAKDAEGNPKVPEGEEDCGKVVAMEIDGHFYVVSWIHPKGEGEEQEDAAVLSPEEMRSMEADIGEKYNVLNQIKTMMESTPYNVSRALDLIEILLSKKAWGTPVEEEILRQAMECKVVNEGIVQENARKKLELVEQAEEAAPSDQWGTTSKKLKELMEEWKQIGYAGEENDNYWERFNQARQSFFNRQREYFDSLNERHDESKEKKNAIIEEAKSIAESTAWKATHQRMEELLKAWKEAGSAGKEEDDALWAAFKEARDVFYTRRDEDRKKTEAIFAERKAQKAALVEEAKGFAGDFSKTAADRMRQLSQEWKEVGFCGKRDDDALWEAFRQAQDAYWGEKKQENAEKILEAVSRREVKIERKRDNIEALKERLVSTRSEAKRADIERWIQEDETDIQQLEKEIADMRKKLDA